MRMKKAPAKKTSAKKAEVSTKKPATKKAAAKKVAVKKTAAKKPAAKKEAAKKTVAKKATAKKAVAKKAAVKKAPTKKTAVKTPVAKKTVVNKRPVQQTPARKTTAKVKQLAKSDMKKFEKMLIAERDHLIASINNIEQASRTESGHDNGADLASFAETGTDSFTLETALNIASSESQRLRDVMDALDRIARGTYGICEGSGLPIPRKRLEAFPSARYGLEYQRELEQEEAMNQYR